MRRKILIADDDPAILDVTRIILEDAGYQVTTSADGNDIYKLKRNYPDLLLLDIRMPGSDGVEICKFLKSKSTTKKIPVILFSANLDGAKMAKQAGAEDFIAKPFDMKDLLKKVKGYMVQ